MLLENFKDWTDFILERWAIVTGKESAKYETEKYKM
jgi:hypothetical protein